MKRQTRSVSAVPFGLLAALIGVVLLQLWHGHFSQGQRIVEFRPLEPPHETRFYQAAALGSDLLLSYLLLLDLQLHDNQSGQHVSYSRLDFQVLDRWLSTVYQMNPRSGYPAFLAARVYSNTPDKRQLKSMINLIERLFQADPQLHWRRMTEACLLAKHQLGDLTRALDLAEQVALLPSNVNIPYWARDMRIILLDELNQLESAQILISSMLQSGQIDDPDETRFLRSRLLKIQQSLSAMGQDH
jgi:hypothetical protein